MKVNMNTIKYKKLEPQVKDITRAHNTDAGIDLYLLNDSEVIGSEIAMCQTGIAVEIPTGYVGLLIPRSSTYKLGVELANTIGVIDSSYRGELKLAMRNTNNSKYTKLSAGTKIAQLVIVQCLILQPELVDELSETERGEGGFGSTGQ